MKGRPISTPFTQSWIQALTASSEIPTARTIKPTLELINAISLNRFEGDRLDAAGKLWSLCESECLSPLLQIVPSRQSEWALGSDDTFIFRRSDNQSASELERGTKDEWLQAIGLTEGKFALTAEVTSSDWMELVRNEAVRLQKPFSTAAAAQTSTMQVPCHARWDTTKWTLSFDQLEWLVKEFGESLSVPRPSLAELNEPIDWAIATADEGIVEKKVKPCSFTLAREPWFDAAPRLTELHERFRKSSKGYSPWLAKCWNAVWPVVYREQNALKGLAHLEPVREEMKACLTSQPRLTVWTFVFARLLCQAQLGMGLGLCADYRD